MKKTFASVNYRRGLGAQQCGKCAMYIKHNARAEFGACTAVSGKITCFGVCDIFAGLRNPFGALPTHERIANLRQQIAALSR